MKRPRGWRLSVLVTVGITVAATAVSSATAASAVQSAGAAAVTPQPAAPAAHW